MALPKKEQKLKLREDEFIEDPKIYFPSRKQATNYYIDYDSDVVDDDYISSFSACRLGEKEWGSKIFWEDFKKSQTVIIIDKYLEQKELEKIKNIVELWENNNTLSGRKLFFYTYEPEIKKYNEILNSIKKLMDKNFTLYSLKFKDRDLIHDRFAILDDNLYHFGGTVGGYQHGLTAFSCGWSDANKKNYNLLEKFKKNHLFYEVTKYD